MEGSGAQTRLVCGFSVQGRQTEKASSRFSRGRLSMLKMRHFPDSQGVGWRGVRMHDASSPDSVLVRY